MLTYSAPGVWMDAMLLELRLAARSLTRTPVFTLAAVLTLALGIGANTAIFSVAYGILWRPLPYHDADRLVVIGAERDYTGRSKPVPTNFSLADLEDFRTRSRCFESVAMVGAISASVMDEVGPRTLLAESVTESFFSVVGGRMVLGRPLYSGDDQSVVISERLWKTQLHGMADAVGHLLTINATAYTIVGVADATFQIPSSNADLWILAKRISNPTLQQRGSGGFLPIVRLKPNATLAEAREDAQAVVAGLMRDYPTRYDHLRATAVPLRESVSGSVRPALVLVFAAVGLLLVVACANVTNLFLVRRAARTREIAVRIALGASSRRLVGQGLAEGGTVAVAGTVAGLLLATLLVRTLVQLAPEGMPRLDAVRLDWLAWTFAAALAATATVMSGLLPAAQFVATADALKSGGFSTSTSTAQRMRNALIVAQLAVVTVLLIGATLFSRSLLLLLHTNIGVSTDHLAAALMDMPYARTAPVEQQAAAMERVLNRVRALPDVVDAAATVALPPGGARLQFTMNRIDEANGQTTNYLVDAVTVTPRFFTALRVPLLKGRFFSDTDDALHAPVMIVSADTARDLFGSGDPIGRVMAIPSTGPSRQQMATLVGIIANVKYAGLAAAPNGAIYRPFAQQPWPSMFVIARTKEDPAALVDALRPAIVGVDHRIAVSQATTLDGLVSDAAAQPRFRTVLVGTFAAVGLLIATVGLYGVVAYAVSRRTFEIGIRIALGATRADVTSMVLLQGLRLSALGIATGMAVSVAFVRTLKTFLYGIAPTDSLSFVIAGVLLLGVSTFASLVPARRATRIDPIHALRSE